MVAVITVEDLSALSGELSESGVFAGSEVADEQLVLKAEGADVDAYYFVRSEGDELLLGVGTPDRWLSESIEAHLMHCGDKIEELIEDELIELDVRKVLSVQHFRDDAKHYIFQSPISRVLNEAGEGERVGLLKKLILAYEAAFRQLGDMDPDA